MDVRHTVLGMHQRIKLIIRRCRNKCLRMITDAYRYVTNDELHNDLAIKWVDEVIQNCATEHERLLRHTNVGAIRLAVAR